MPVLTIGGDKANGEALGRQAHAVASEVTVIVLKDTGHWLLEERPKETTEALKNFL
jgi:pimeloyl-ACP methyl ester carboxylesterase